MPAPTTIAWIILGVAALIALAIVVPMLVFRILRGPLEARINSELPEHDIVKKDLTANCFGLESAGVWQLRGNGALVLTETQLHFFMFMPKKEFCVPLNSITEVSLVKSHLGKATIHDLLKLRFTADGKDDSIAWYVPNAAEWKSRVEERMPAAR
jgi:hypothetical protein